MLAKRLQNELLLKIVVENIVFLGFMDFST